MLNFHSSMSCGDIIYSLPFIRWVHEDSGEPCTLHITQTAHKSTSTFKSLERLLKIGSSDYLAAVKVSANGIEDKAEYNLDFIRRSGNLRKMSYWENYFKVFACMPAINENTFRPWLDVPLNHAFGFPSRTYHITPRYPADNFDWVKVFEKRKLIVPDVYVGYPLEYQPYKNYFRYQHCSDLLEMAQVINQSNEFFCNQSSGLTIAQAMGHKNINLAVAKGFTSVYGLRNETLLNK